MECFHLENRTSDNEMFIYHKAHKNRTPRYDGEYSSRLNRRFALSRVHPLIFSSQVTAQRQSKTLPFLIDFNICKFLVSVYN